MTVQLGDKIAILMVLWKLTEYMYIYFTYRYERRNALPDGPPTAITAGAASAYGGECLSTAERRIYSVERPTPCFAQREQKHVHIPRNISEGPEGPKRPPRAITAGATLAYGEECLPTLESRIYSVKRSPRCFLKRKKVPTERDMAEATILSQKKNNDILQELAQMIKPIHRLIGEHWDARYIRFTNIFGDKHHLLVESCKSPEGFVYYLMSTLRDRTSRWTLLKGAIERGEFWIVDEKDDWDSPHRIGSSPAILADNWEENAIAGRAFRMMIVDSLHPATPDELRLMHSTWYSCVKGSLQEIYKLSGWEIKKS
ncbi:uncharacterized protein BKA55DRAFT_599866 [Fusarium redolens]|uniref:Uncharacterized protein n=1 Tax=Fusarium redolens TaxID=48865 RepID=A0A9P9FYW7_FUSRE|nr:uncharacterized protein BKA55DRAFT_599866 [Fusarium redolens]KAH7210787.1 hypothetical protein BKA55DRAFT_599866 [Fusarium redolens]